MRSHLIFIPILLLTTACASNGDSILGFDVGNATIPTEEIKRGGPPPDGIPSIDNPQFTKAGAVDYLEDDDMVIGLSRDGVTRAYPFRILIWHEIVNDTVAGKHIAVTYCPLCATAMVFKREYGDRTLTFGVSGLLYNSDVLMFDRETKSLWSQLGLKAVSGEYVGTEMEWISSRQMTWEAWRERYPESEVLNLDTGHRRDYRNLPYQSYFESPATMFSYERNRDDIEPKELVVGVRHEGAEKAYWIEGIPHNKPVEDTIGGAPVAFHYDADSGLFEIHDAEGNPIPVVHSYWFAWQAFYPDTELWQ